MKKKLAKQGYYGFYTEYEETMAKYKTILECTDYNLNNMIVEKIKNRTLPKVDFKVLYHLARTYYSSSGRAGEHIWALDWLISEELITIARNYRIECSLRGHRIEYVYPIDFPF